MDAELARLLKAGVAEPPADWELKEMIDELRRRSEEFATLWAGGAVGRHKTARKTIDHPQIGPIDLDCDVLSAHGSDVRIVVFNADPGSEADQAAPAVRPGQRQHAAPAAPEDA